MSAASSTRILVVDDEATVREAVAEILGQEGYHSASVPSVDTALELLASERFDVVLTELRMKGQSDLNLLAEIQRIWPDTTTIVLTESESRESAIEARRGGAYDYLIKPFDAEELKATVARAAERGALARALRERTNELDDANEKLRSLSEELEQRLKTATGEFSYKLDEIAGAKQDLEEAERQRLEFTAIVAHELNQPLTTISGSAQLLSRKGLPPEMEERARSTIVTETRRLARLVQDLTDASELAAGRFRVQLGSCDLAQITREQVDQIAMARTGQEVTLEITADQTATACDADRMAQVISNLLSNATKYAPGSPVRVTIRNADGKVQLSVADHGPGIPADRLEAIFQPRVRLVENEPGRDKRGRGLGLYIARGIVEAHGGRIWAAPGDQGGALFTIELPVRSST